MAEELHLNERACKILESLERQVPVIEYGNIKVFDIGVDQDLDNEQMGIKVAEASMGGLGKVYVKEDRLYVDINDKPAIATLGCQLAGWSIKINGNVGLGSGPARIPAQKPKVFVDKTKYFESSEKVSLVLETDVIPTEEVCKKILEDAQASELIIAAFKGDSRIGMINILARVVEMAFFRLDFLKFDTLKIVKACGNVPMSQDLDTFGCNDLIRHRGYVRIETSDWNPALTEKAVNTSTKTFRKIFDDGGNFYDIDPEVFAPAELDVLDIRVGKEYHAGNRVQKERD